MNIDQICLPKIFRLRFPYLISLNRNQTKKSEYLVFPAAALHFNFSSAQFVPYTLCTCLT